MHIELTIADEGIKVLYPINRLVVTKYKHDEAAYVWPMVGCEQKVVESYEQVKRMISIMSEVVAQSE
jgi:hypothetical protein